jgi:hypothetical protein
VQLSAIGKVISYRMAESPQDISRFSGASFSVLATHFLGLVVSLDPSTSAMERAQHNLHRGVKIFHRNR